MLIPTLLKDYLSSIPGATMTGAYGVTQASGATVSIVGGTTIARLRWPANTAPANFLVLLKIRAGWEVTGAVTAATPMDLQAVIARGFTVDFSANMTVASIAAVANTNQMFAQHRQSAMGASGPSICTTAAGTGGTMTADAFPFAATTWVNQPSGNGTVTQAIGVAGQMQALYEWTSPGQHPVLLSNNEGVLLQPITAGPVTGTVKYVVEWTWAECIVP